MRPLLVYVHGFLSSGASAKARQCAEFLRARKLPIDFISPTLSNYPGEAAAQLDRLLDEIGEERVVGLIGSSMGGFHACYLSQKRKLRAVLVNPAAHPYELIRAYLGEHSNPYTGQVFSLGEDHIVELRARSIDPLPSPELLWVLLQTGDETLDYREAQQKFSECAVDVASGGDHSYRDFEQKLPEIVDFLFH